MHWKSIRAFCEALNTSRSRIPTETPQPLGEDYLSRIRWRYARPLALRVLCSGC
jgi:hypothetical protein